MTSTDEYELQVIYPQILWDKNKNVSINDFTFSMSNLPKNAGYDPKEYYFGYCKFFMFGDTKESIPANIKINNKVGEAQGTLIDCAHIVDSENKVEFMVAATPLVNKDCIFNDVAYDYDKQIFLFQPDWEGSFMQKT